MCAEVSGFRLYFKD